ncbi:hypothetical protein [Thioalkalivibrio sulfidiphilus]|uniref:hypothetical protein n=1 Tax=Thioalkalivibrio sulfidiphilus TaxID=1033854 RepID=UPI003BAF0777
MFVIGTYLEALLKWALVFLFEFMNFAIGWNKYFGGGMRQLNGIFRKLIFQHQRLVRRMDVGWREQYYLSNYEILCANTPWLKRPVFPSPAGGTANASMLYLLLSVLVNEGPKRIVELGAGQSTLLLAQYVDWQKNSAITSIDHDRYWIDILARDVGDKVDLVHRPLVDRRIADLHFSWYDIKDFPLVDVELLIVDGPPAYARHNRYSRYGIIEFLPDVLSKDFIIIIDDAGRNGEYRLSQDIVRKLPNGVRAG